ncbi:MAG: hypothetical protein PUG71_07545 [bacterium]|nr:hypothetical protein [bacterium]
MKKGKMYNCWKIIVITVMVMLFISGCSNPVDSDPFEEYKEMHTPDYTYLLEERYETKEKLYKEIVDLSVWGMEKENAIRKAFERKGELDYSESYRIDKETELDDYIKRKSISNMDAYGFRDVQEELLKECTQEVVSHYKKILRRVSAEVISYEEKAYKDLATRLFAIARSEAGRRENDYEEMFYWLIYDLEYDIFYTLYPEELLEGAKMTIDRAYEKDDLLRVADFLKDIGKYEEYEAQIESAKNAIDERNRCDYEGCTSLALTSIEGKAGKYCYYHADYLTGKLGRSHKNYSSTQSNNHTVKDDPYDVYDYSDPEDFYYDNYDDFYDYEDAEDYYDEAWDE